MEKVTRGGFGGEQRRVGGGCSGRGLGLTHRPAGLGFGFESQEMCEGRVTGIC